MDHPTVADLPVRPRDDAGEPAAAANDAPAAPSAAMPPAMAAVKQTSADELLREMNRMPLFMTTLDETDGEGGENIELEAIKALAYEGTRAEVAENFRQQGNEQAQVKNWADAKEFYDKALAALKGPHMYNPNPDIEVFEEPDPEVEKKKEVKIEEACYTNRALCNLEKKNYRSCMLDCASALRLNPNNVKAWYRSATACLALDKMAEAEDACKHGLDVEPNNASLQTLSKKIAERKKVVEARQRREREREERARAEKATLRKALRDRNIPTRETAKPPEMEDAVVKLEKPLDATSTLSIPVLFLYPADAQSDFVKEFRETESLLDHLSYIFPLPWDEKNRYQVNTVDCYVETAAGGLIKAGKKLPLLKILSSGKMELVDGLLKVHVVPASEAKEWIEEFKKRRPA